jgi:ligand-binding sensor domain-containing protein
MNKFILWKKIYQYMRIVVIIICLLGTFFHLKAQQTLYQHFTVEEGLPSLTINQVNQDQLGYIWLATNKGLSKYDGYQFVNYTVKDGLPSNNIREIYIDQSNRIWLISDGNAIAFVKNNEITTLTPSSEIFEIKPKGIHESNDDIWIDTEQGLFSYKNGQLELYELPDKEWEFLGIDEKGIKWFYDEDARLYPDGNPQKVIQIPLDSNEILDSRIFQWSDGRLYFETEEQLYFYKDTLTPIKLFSGLSISEQHAPHLISRRDVRFFNKKGQLETEYRHQGSFKLQGAFKDREDNWWFNTLDDGLYLLTANAQLSKTFNIQNGLDDPFVTAVTKDNQGNIFAGTENGDLYFIANGDDYPSLFPLANTRKMKVLLADNEYLYIGSRQGLHILSKENFEMAMFGFGITSGLAISNCNPPNCLIKKNSKNFFISGSVKGVNDLFLNEKHLYIATESGVWELDLEHEDAFKMTLISEKAAKSVVIYNDEIWIGTSKGIFKQEKEATGKSKNLLPHPTNQIVRGADNDLWVGTDGFGIFHYKNDRFELLKSTERDIVERIVLDEMKTVWAATNNGVKSIDFKENKHEVRPYQVADGLPTKETNTLYSDKSNIYVGTNRGFTIMDKIKLSRNKATPPVYFKNIIVNNETTAPQKTLKLNYKENNISIQYVGISIKSNKKITYLHKMDGVDKKWQQTELTELSYRGLSPNNYTFHIKAIDVEGRASEERTMTFIIRPPYWETLWFRGLIILGLAGLIYFFLQKRIQNVQKREQEKAFIQKETADLQLKVAEERTEIERINNELAKSKLETLQAQMNPHFAYNALTSIQMLILKKDNKTANKYLVKFARLMRQFLEASKETYIPLNKEIELLKLYIEMEQLRFKDKFQVQYDISPTVKTGEIPIPSMLLQVFVENAINHGLVYKKGTGILKFIVKKEGEKVLCIVEDDGIGRTKAQAIKQQSAGSYKGLGMKISEERVRYLNMTENIKVNVVIEDDILDDEQGGTRVNVFIIKEGN